MTCDSKTCLLVLKPSYGYFLVILVNFKSSFSLVTFRLSLTLVGSLELIWTIF